MIVCSMAMPWIPPDCRQPIETETVWTRAACEGVYSHKAYWRMANSGVVKRALTKESQVPYIYSILPYHFGMTPHLDLEIWLRQVMATP